MPESLQARRRQSRHAFNAKENKMSSPPTSFSIDSWDNGKFAPVLFPVGGSVDTNLDSTTGLYDLTWTNGNDEDRLLSLPWTSNPSGGGEFSGNAVTIYELSGTGTPTPLMTVDVTIAIDENGKCVGTLDLAGTQPSETEMGIPEWTPNPGVFVAQAEPG
jgi:hypothetical protein